MSAPNTSIVDFDTQDSGYTDVQVLHSAAGYYIGTLYINGPSSCFPNLIEPGSRDSGYYATEAEARQALETGSYHRVF